MPTLTADDGVRLAYRTLGDAAGDPIVCLPGGPMQDADYLGDLGGLPARRPSVLLDPRGTGASEQPEDPSTYRCDRQVDDVEALRRHLGLERVTLLGHSAGANLAVLYAARHPDRVEALLLLTPSTFVLGLSADLATRRAVLALRPDEPWSAAATGALDRLEAGEDADWDALVPPTYGRWDDAARAHHDRGARHRNDEAAEVFGEGAFDPPATRAALAGLAAPVLVLAGEFDVNSPPVTVREYAAAFPGATCTVLPGCAHFPWLDEPARLTDAIDTFLKG